MSKNFMINPFRDSSFSFFLKSKNNTIKLYFGIPCSTDEAIDTLDPLYILLKDKYKSFFVDKLNNSSSVEKRTINGEVVYLKKKSINVNGTIFIPEINDGYFSFFKYDLYVNDVLVMKNQTSANLKLPDFIFNEIDSKVVKLKLFFNDDTNTSNYFHEVSFNINTLTNVYDFSSLNSGNPCKIVANGYTLILAPGSSIGVMVIDSIVRNSDNVKISKIMCSKANKIDAYKTLVVGSEIPFINKDMIGETVLDTGIELSLFFYSYLDPNYNNVEKVGTITLSSIHDSIKFLPYKYYDCDCNNDSNNLVIVPNKTGLMCTPQFNNNPLFFYFVIKGELGGEINLIDDEMNDVLYNIVSYDSVTHFIYFNAIKDRTYSFLMDGYYYLKEYEKIMDSYYDAYTVNSKLELGNIYFDKVIAVHPTEDFVNIHYYLENGDVFISNNTPVAYLSYDNLPAVGYNTTNYFKSLTTKHTFISSKVKKIEAYTLKGEPLSNLTLLNYFTNHSYSDGNLHVYKKQNECVYFAKLAEEYLYNESDIQNLVIGKRYALENKKFIEFDDGYIEFSELSYDSFFYHDTIEDIKENSKNNMFSYIITKKHDPSVIDFFNKNFKTPGIPLKNKGGV